MPKPCPCGLKLTRDACCGRFIDAHAAPVTAAELMRSRYAAYCEGAVDYLVSTTAAPARAALDAAELRDYCAGLRGVRLEIVRATAGGADDAEGEVEFRAHLRHRGRPFVQAERSRFTREGGRWVYAEALE